ncbi:MAG: RsmE family RNA methyltransferase, partial [Planococcaceae bacterium]|nr:RsmE family RNA methyltransferase [Planococcaceae bacterium]
LKFDSILVVFGPEGGLSRREISELHEKGFHSISLGPRILRAETAPLYVLSAISYELE